jgi:hypothetical protein
MEKKRTVQYSVRDISEDMDNRLRECAAMEGVSLNQATLRAIQRGLGAEGEPVRYRSLRDIVSSLPKGSRRAWRTALEEQDQINPEDWR